MNKSYYKKLRMLLLFVGIFLLLVIHAFANFESQFLNAELEQKQLELEKTAKIKAESIKEKHDDMVQSLQVLGENVKALNTPTKSEITLLLTLSAKTGYFDYVGICDAEGNSMDSEQHISNIQNRSYYKDAMEGKISISDVMPSRIDNNEEVQVMAVPIRRENYISGVVFGIMKIGNMDQFMENETGSNIYTQIVDSNGKYITRMQTKDSLIRNNNVWDDFAEFDFLEGSIESIKDDIKTGCSDSFMFRMGDEERFSFYMPLGIRDHYIFSTVNSQYIKNRTARINQKIYYMMAEVGVAFLILLIGLIWFNKIIKQELQTSHAKVVSSAEMMRIAIKHSKQLIFEYSEKEKKLWRKAGVVNSLFDDDQISNVPDSIIFNGKIAEESIDDFRTIFEPMPQQETLERLIRFKDPQNDQWFRIVRKNIYDDHRQILKVIGIVENVTEEILQQEMLEEGKKENAVLQKRAERDELTGLYNAATVKTKIQEYLDSPKGKEGIHMLLLLDLDNFKKINDTFGHQYGDQVLKETAELLRKNFRQDDILGRLGGDEFVAFLTKASDFKTMEHVFARLCKQLQRTYTKNGQSVTVSASLGITESPKNGLTFLELYEKADQTLYEVKRADKNGYKEFKL